MKVLLIEDDSDIAVNLYDYLKGADYDVDLASNGVTGLHLAVTEIWDAILLDVSLPGMDGLTLCRKLRQDAHRDTPVLMLTARDTLEDKLAGFDQGADDYLVKPFSLKEVGARLGALIKRSKGKLASTTLHCADISLDTATLHVQRGGRPVKLPPKCLHMLQIFMRVPNRVVRRAELETAIWGGPQRDSDTLRTHVHTLRRALTENCEADLIETVQGFGYRIVAGDAQSN